MEGVDYFLDRTRVARLLNDVRMGSSTASETFRGDARRTGCQPEADGGIGTNHPCVHVGVSSEASKISPWYLRVDNI